MSAASVTAGPDRSANSLRHLRVDVQTERGDNTHRPLHSSWERKRHPGARQRYLTVVMKNRLAPTAPSASERSQTNRLRVNAATAPKAIAT
jgi:hypothetical protein